MRKIIITAVLMLLSAGLYAQNEPDFVFEPEDISPAPLTKLEKAEAELALRIHGGNSLILGQSKSDRAIQEFKADSGE